jgi:hypothetical protein
VVSYRVWTRIRVGSLREQRRAPSRSRKGSKPPQLCFSAESIGIRQQMRAASCSRGGQTFCSSSFLAASLEASSASFRALSSLRKRSSSA